MVYYYGFLLLRWMAAACFLDNKYCVLGAEMVASTPLPIADGSSHGGSCYVE